jgi:hypothetical protein
MTFCESPFSGHGAVTGTCVKLSFTVVGQGNDVFEDLNSV